MSQRRSRNNNNRPRGTTQRVVAPMKYRDTIQQEASSSVTAFVPNDLLPGLTGRNVVFRKIYIELLPETSITTPGVVAQVTAEIPIVSFDAPIASGTAKVLSRVNPTNFVIDFDMLSLTSPAIKFPVSADETSIIIGQLILNAAPANPLTARITSIVDVYPQLEF